MGEINTMRIVYSPSFDPYYNLALEEALFHSCEKKEEIILYIWRNENAVIVGRNQNVYMECEVAYAIATNTKIVRRLSGGGTVYHDLGNLNYSFIFPRNICDDVSISQIILNAVKNNNIDVCRNGRNDFVVNGRKFSGNAFYSSEKVRLYHGTIMIDVDLQIMQKLLITSRSKLRRKGISSVRSCVINLKEINPELSCLSFGNALEEAFTIFFDSNGDISREIRDDEKKEVEELIKKYSSDEWNYHQVEEYAFCISQQFQWGFVEITCELKGCEIQQISIISDSLFPDLIDEISQRLNKRETMISTGLTRSSGSIEMQIVKDVEELFEKVCRRIKDGI